ncbi:MAG: hypothetical protein V3U65_15965 [Granulosicoccaceae bacterium]
MSIEDHLKKTAVDKIEEYGFDDEVARNEFAKLKPQEAEALRKRFRDDPEDEILQRIIKKLDS